MSYAFTANAQWDLLPHYYQTKNAIINFVEVARLLSITATEDAPWIFEVFIADHCAFVRLRLTEICMATSTPGS